MRSLRIFIAVLVVATLICPSLFSQVIVVADPPSQAEKPTLQEIELFKTLLARFKNQANFAPYKIDNATEALIDYGGKPLEISQSCPHESPVTACKVKISIHHEKFNVGNKIAAGYFRYQKRVITIVAGEKIIDCNYRIALNVQLMAIGENEGEIGKTGNDATFYHELLHAEIMIDNIEDPNWDGWDSACKCQLPEEELYPADPEHIIIHQREDQYAIAVASSKGATLVIERVDKRADGNGEFTLEFPVPPEYFQKENRKLSSVTANIKQPLKRVDVKDGQNLRIVVTGELDDKSKGGFLWVWFDPPELWLIGEGIVDPAPTLVGGIWVPVDKSSLLAPYIGLASTVMVATVATSIYARRVKRREEKR